MTGDRSKPTAPGWRGLPAGIWVLGLVSMLMDISSEMIHALLPVYLTVGLGASALVVGVIEGIAEATAAITKVFSGALSDRIGRRKELAALGYGLAAVTKPVFPLAPSLGWLVAARFIDRVGKGIRAAPRDALVADLAPEGRRGAAFGLRQSLDTFGAFLGPVLAIALMWAFADDFRSVFWVAVIPAFAALGLILFAVKEPARPEGLRRVRNPLSRAEIRLLGRTYWAVVAVAAVFTLARFSEAFLILRAEAAGLSLMLVPLVLVGMNAVYAVSAWPAGVLSDRMSRPGLLMVGLGVLIAADLALALAPGLAGLGLGVALWGLHMGLTQGLMSALVAEAVPAELRGTAFGLFNLVTGGALLLASMIAGGLWQGLGSQATFLAGAAFALIAALGLVPLRRRLG
ncbi:MFS transporter [Rhodobacter calidifons]|uniref:MFS transporter n=1 Tax=Rhodobacter calidifons TaxID=2715277 RepID=A0ABX0G3L5_9RHOB|nr:MFS transporter [Rhodobacter calidifons]NHB75812.1 MFS transporter [Rhodobacter calidifons]